MNEISNESALHSAVRMGNYILVDEILDGGADIDEGNSKGERPLHIAVAYGNSLVVNKFLHNGKIIEKADYKGKESVYTILFKNCCKLVDSLLGRGALVDAKTCRDETPLHIAVRLNRKEIVEKLLRKGAMVEVRNSERKTPLDIATAQGCLEVAKVLLDNGAVVGSNYQELLHKAVRWFFSALVDQLLSSNGDVDVKNSKGETGLHIAAHSNYCSMVEKFIDRGANIDEENAEGETPLNIAVANGHVSIIDRLITEGASLDIRYNHGYTALHAAVAGKNIPLAEKLLHKGFQVDVRDENGKTPLHFAVCNTPIEMVIKLIDWGADIEAKDNDGCTPLFNAVKFKCSPAVDLLLEEGADVDSRNNSGETPLFCASKSSRPTSLIINSLLDHGASISFKYAENTRSYYYNSGHMNHREAAKARTASVKSWHIIETHVFKLATAGFPLRCPILTRDLKKLYLDELEVINSTPVYENVTLGIIFSHRLKPHYMANIQLVSNIQELLDSPHVFELFPNYANTLKSTFKKSKVIYRLFTLASRSLFNLLRAYRPDPVLPMEIIFKIVDQLDDSVQRHLVKSGFYCVPSNLAQNWCEELPDLIKNNTLDHYLTDKELQKLLRNKLDLK